MEICMKCARVLCRSCLESVCSTEMVPVAGVPGVILGRQIQRSASWTESLERITQQELLRNSYGMFEAAIDLWGMEAQQKMVVEELLECALELHRAVSGRRTWGNAAMISEIADAKIMLAQLDLMVDEDAVTRAMRFTLDRLAQRLNSAANEEGGS